MPAMASYHCTVKAGASSSASAHAAYIERDGKYKTKSRDDLEAVESGNLPSWAERSSDFWKASDSYERANAKGYREYEVALPREMLPAQRLELVRDFIRQELGDCHAYTFAIHNPRAALEGGEQPHAHIMFSERQRDSIERPEAQYFKRWNAKNPEKGGCKKGDGYKSAEQRKTELVALRERWASLQNGHLEKHGHADRVDHRTLKERGIERMPTEHLGPTAAAMEQRGVPTRRGLAKAQREADVAEVAGIPELSRRLRADCVQLVKLEAAKPDPTPSPVKPDQVKPNPIQERRRQEEMSVQIVKMWREVVQKEREEHLQELTVKALETAKAFSVHFQAHMDAEPMLFGRKAWEAKRVAMDRRYDRLKVDYDELKTGRYPFLNNDKEAVQKEALQRATAKQPKLAAAQAPAEAILRAKDQREQEERMQRAREEDRIRQARKAERGQDRGYSR
jgi:hypothetical protein